MARVLKLESKPLPGNFAKISVEVELVLTEKQYVYVCVVDIFTEVQFQFSFYCFAPFTSRYKRYITIY